MSTSTDIADVEKKFALHDGVNAVKRVAILALFRNNAKFLATYLLPKFVAMEAAYDVDFDFYFLENNSSDATKAMLELFLKDTGCDGNTRRRGRLITLDLPDIVNEGINFERTARLAFLRNTLVDFVAPFEAPYCLLLDSDIYFDTDTLAKLFAHEPRKKNIGLLGPFAREALLGPRIRDMKIDGCENCKDDDMITTTHYYDTFAFVDKDSHNYWPKCPFDSCTHCPRRCKKHEPGLMFVTSCYGGFVLVDSEVFNKHRDTVKWGTIDIAGGKISFCEHVLFNVRLAAATGKKIAIAGDVTNVYWTG